MTTEAWLYVAVMEAPKPQKYLRWSRLILVRQIRLIPCEGIVTNLEGLQLKGGAIEIWQCDEAGHYDHPSDGSKINPAFQGFGRVLLDAEGRFRIRTIKPVPYTGRTPHIHAKIKLGKRELLTTQFYVEGDPGNASDMLFRRIKPQDRALITSPYTPVADGLQARYSVVVEA